MHADKHQSPQPQEENFVVAHPHQPSITPRQQGNKRGGHNLSSSSVGDNQSNVVLSSSPTQIAKAKTKTKGKGHMFPERSTPINPIHVPPFTCIEILDE
ncbi:hypothetical protein V6N13_015137 [Hibiscus sabdariffa]|uniref:Uncharacterized protein n=2 Tax=Hibiscus sabdariffa TaxID=183260 RepID=A0ABR2AQI4_9ROSI